MPTSGTATFNLEFDDIIEEAFERCGKELRSGYGLRTARRSLNLLTVEWSNRGINLCTIEQGSIALTDNQAIYPLPVDTIDVVEHVTRKGTGQNQQDLAITRISVSTYATIPNKLNQARPIQVWIQRLDGQISPTGFTYQSADTGAQTVTLSSTVGLATMKKVKLQPPRMYKVIMHNDDYTTTEFVVHVLQKYFSKPFPEAQAIMQEIHGVP